MSKLRRWFVTGLLLLLPLAVSVWVLVKAVQILAAVSRPWVVTGFRWAGVEPPPGTVTTLAFAATATLITVVGALSGGKIGGRLLAALEGWAKRLPVVRTTYGSAKQLVDAIGLGKGGAAFSEVVLVEFPRKELFSLGFVTRGVGWLPEDARVGTEPMVHVFIPTTPNPTSGWLILVPLSQARTLPLSVEEGIKLVVSGGMVTP